MQIAIYEGSVESRVKWTYSLRPPPQPMTDSPSRPVGSRAQMKHRPVTWVFLLREWLFTFSYLVLKVLDTRVCWPNWDFKAKNKLTQTLNCSLQAARVRVCNCLFFWLWLNEISHFLHFACRLRHPGVKSTRNGWHKLNRKLKNCKELMTCCELSFLLFLAALIVFDGI